MLKVFVTLCWFWRIRERPSGKWCVMLAMIRSVRAIMINPGRIDQTDSFLKLHSPVSKFTWWKCLWRDPILSCRRLQNHMVWFIPICKVQWKCSWTFHDFHHVVKFRPRPALIKFDHFNLKTLIQQLIDGLNSYRRVTPLNSIRKSILDFGSGNLSLHS